jgi:hypothetical protein
VTTDGPTPIRAKKLLTPEEARRAIYVDFEGRKAEPEMVLGVSWQRHKSGPPSLRHYIVDQRLAPIADQIEIVGDDVAEHEWVIATTRQAITELLQLAKKQDRLIVAWSQHDFKVVADGRGLSPYQRRHLVPRYRDAKETARKWVNRGIAGTVLPPGKGHTLDRYQRMIGYQVPNEYGIGRTGENLGKLIDALEKRGTWDALTDRQQRRAIEIIGHNYHDLDGMREIATQAADGIATAEGTLDS